jgi:MFS transporter, PPP family, 3-phenylpropionic acid transporter
MTIHAPVPAARLATFYCFYFGFLGVFAPYWALYLKSVGLSSAQIGVLLALIPVTRMIGPAFWGWVADSRGQRAPIVRITTIGTLIAFCGVFFGSSFAWLFAVMLAMNLFWGGTLPLVEATTLGHLGDRLGGYGRIRAWGSVGFVVVVVAAGYALDLTGIGAAAWMIAALLALHVATSFNIPEAPNHPHHNDHVKVWDILRRPEVIALFAGCFLSSVANGPYNTFYSIWLVDHDYSKGAVGLLWALGVVAEIIVFWMWTRISGRFPLKTLLLAGYGITFARYLAIGWLPTSGLVMFVAQIAHAATFGFFHGAAVALVHRFFRGRHQAKGQALYSGIGFGAGGAVGGLLSGFLWDHVGGAVTFSIGAAAAAIAFGVTARWLRIAEPART